MMSRRQRIGLGILVFTICIAVVVLIPLTERQNHGRTLIFQSSSIEHYLQVINNLSITGHEQTQSETHVANKSSVNGMSSRDRGNSMNNLESLNSMNSIDSTDGMNSMNITPSINSINNVKNTNSSTMSVRSTIHDFRTFHPKILFNLTHAEKEICQRYDYDASRERKVRFNIMNNPVDRDQSLVTMVTQMSAERFSMLSRIAKTWEGSISVALYATAKGYKNFILQYNADLALRTRINIYIHYVRVEGQRYPTNFLRNVGLRFDTGSRFVFLNDIDFVPANNAEEEIRRHINEIHLHGQQALVVPGFEETSINSQEALFPKHKWHLLAQWKKKKIRPFHGGEYMPGHKSTNFPRWKKTQKVYEIFYQEYFEPYVVVERAFVPPYPQRFVGRYYDKISHIMNLYYLGFRFFVAPNTFVVHLSHKKDVKKESVYHKCAFNVYWRYRKEFQSNLGNQTAA